MYGPTETTIWSSTYRVEQVNQSVPIGRPIANTTMYILDGGLQPVPIGLPGELYIGGEGVVRGYWNRPDLTADRFIPDPFNTQQPGARLYKTGDLARYLPDGNIEFLGRSDFQVKIRGHRIELGEIESALDQHPTIQKSVVTAREDTPGDKRLVAYILANGHAAASANEFRAYLRDKLPDFMIPSHFMTLEAFPLTPNGKVDRKALPPPQQSRPEPVTSQGAPASAMERTLASIWEEVLSMDNVSIYDNFFDLGGHSLQVIQVVTHLESATGVKLDPVRMRFETLGQLAAFCETAAANPQSAAPAESGLPKKFLSSMRRLVTGKPGSR
jgi:acyl carrier protein